mmetsp:Transcript_3560/g.10353  ORF Transcript_3560/g.10353 Transcript_3560/m.10353 type:complete len:263 (+) Transcript_3560:2062-2850(+)
MHFENGFSACQVRTVDTDLPVKPSWSQECLVQNVGSVGASQHDDTLSGGKSVHLHQQLVQRVLTLVVAASKTALAAGPPDGIDLINEDDGWALRAGLCKQVPHAGGPHAHEHLHEVRPADGQEGHPRLTCRRLGQQGLAGSRRADQQCALWNLGAQLLVLARVLQEVHKLKHLLLRLIAPRHILEHDLLRGFVHRAHLCLANVENAAGAAPAQPAKSAPAASHGAARNPDVSRYEQQSRCKPQQFLLPPDLVHVLDWHLFAQ